MGKLEKYSLEHNDWLYVASVSQRRVRKPPTDHIPQWCNLTFLALAQSASEIEHFETFSCLQENQLA